MKRSLAILSLLAAGGASRGLADPGTAAPVFDHRQHAEAGITLTCVACHASSSDGRLDWPGADHKPCANSICHADEFREPEAPLCLVCHKSSDPFAPNPLRTAFSGRNPFDGRFSHGQHLQLPLLRDRSGCATCHPAQSGEPPPSAPAGILAPSHLRCASCHEALSPPRMTECEACHVRPGEALAPPASGPEWRVRDKFDHDDHRVDVRTADAVSATGQGWDRYARDSAEALPCADCHRDVRTADGVPPRPGKPDCTGCHDGDHAFKTSGFECARCHGPVRPQGPSPTEAQ